MNSEGVHFHADEVGVFHRCYHRCRTAVLSVGFWVGLTVGYLPEHWLWEKLWPFTLLTKAMGL